jgi:hypothetical protein
MRVKNTIPSSLKLFQNIVSGDGIVCVTLSGVIKARSEVEGGSYSRSEAIDS